MSSAESGPSPRYRGPISVAYTLIVLGIIMILVGIFLTLIRDCSGAECEFVYMVQGLIAICVGLFVLFFSVLLFFIPTQPRGYEGGDLTPRTPCPRCGRPTSWIQPEQKWYCYHCQEYARAGSAPRST